MGKDSDPKADGAAASLEFLFQQLCFYIDTLNDSDSPTAAPQEDELDEDDWTLWRGMGSGRLKPLPIPPAMSIENLPLLTGTGRPEKLGCSSHRPESRPDLGSFLLDMICRKRT